MKSVRSQGLVLRYTNVNESDRMLTIFSPSHGRLSVLARGCRKPKSRFLSASQLFCYGSYILFPYKDIYILSQAEIENAYYDIRSDMERLAHGSYILNLTEEVITAEEDNSHIFNLLLHALTYLSYSEMDPGIVTLIYEIKLLDLIGYRPVLKSCLICHRDPIKGDLFFSSIQGGVLCPDCKAVDPSAQHVHPGTLQTIIHILDMDISRMGILRIMPEVFRQLNKIIPAYITEKLDKDIKSRGFIEIYKTSMDRCSNDNVT